MILTNIKKYLNLDFIIDEKNDEFNFIKIVIEYIDSESVIYEYPITDYDYITINNIVIPNAAKASKIELLSSISENRIKYVFSDKRKSDKKLYKYRKVESSEKLIVSFNYEVSINNSSLYFNDDFHSNGTLFLADDDGNEVIDDIVKIISEQQEIHNFNNTDLIFIGKNLYKDIALKMQMHFPGSKSIVEISYEQGDDYLNSFSEDGFLRDKVINQFISVYNKKMQTIDHKKLSKDKNESIIIVDTKDGLKSAVIAEIFSAKKEDSKIELINMRQKKSELIAYLNLYPYIGSRDSALLKVEFENKSVKYYVIDTNEDKYKLNIKNIDIIYSEIVNVCLIICDESSCTEFTSQNNIKKALIEFRKQMIDNIITLNTSEKFINFSFSTKDNAEEESLNICDKYYRLVYQIFPPFLGDGLINNLVIDDLFEDGIINIVTNIDKKKIKIDLSSIFNINDINKKYLDKYEVTTIGYDDFKFLGNARGNMTNPSKIIINFPGFHIHTDPIQYIISYYKNLDKLIDENNILVYSMIDCFFTHGTYMLIDNNGDNVLLKYAEFIMMKIKEYGLREEDVILFGASKGGTIAIAISDYIKSAHLITICPQLDLEKYAITRHNFRGSTLKYLRSGNANVDYFELLRNKFKNGDKVLYVYGIDDFSSNGYYSQYIENNVSSIIVESRLAHNQITKDNMFLVDGVISSDITGGVCESNIVMNNLSFIDNLLSVTFRDNKNTKCNYYIGTEKEDGIVNRYVKLEEKNNMLTQLINVNEDSNVILLSASEINKSNNGLNRKVICKLEKGMNYNIVNNKSISSFLVRKIFR